MKKLIFLFVLVVFTKLNAQLNVTSDLKFDTPIYLAENKWIVLPPKESDKNFLSGFVYFDNAAGYTLEIGDNFEVKNNAFSVIPNQNKQKSSMKMRIKNMMLKVAVLSDDRIKQMSLNKIPDWLQNYQTNDSENEKIFKRASFLNGSGFSLLALEKLNKLYNADYRPSKLYFEVIFGFNALRKYDDAYKFALEAAKNNFTDDLILKESVYALVNMKKNAEVEEFFNKNLKKYTNENFKSESLLNYILSLYNSKDIENTKKWLNVYHTEIKNVPPAHKKYIDQIQNEINNKK